MNSTISSRTILDKVLILTGAVCLAGALTTASHAQTSCQIYPIALSSQTIATATNGQVLVDIYNGSNPGNFGWLSWAGDPSEPTLVTSLQPPGNSATYTNPYDPNDHQILAGSWVRGKPGVSNSINVRDALDVLEDIDIVVPVWDSVQGSGSNAIYHISGFALVRIKGYRLPNQNRITAVFLGTVDCGSWTT
jgi:hypothetical protein